MGFCVIRSLWGGKGGDSGEVRKDEQELDVPLQTEKLSLINLSGVCID